VGDSNIVLEFQVWVDQSQSDFSKARSIAIRETKHALENTGFSLPEPIYRLRFEPTMEEVFNHHEGQQQGVTAAQTLPQTVSTEKEQKAIKQEAKARAKRVLQGGAADEVLDTQPDTKLMEKVNQEIAENADDTDLLDHNSPQE
jgi:hypothetical protein